MAWPKIAIDSNGRHYTLKEITPGAMMDLLEAAGTASINSGYVRYSTAIVSVTAIDDVPVAAPTDKIQLRALGERIGNAGVIAIFDVLFGEDRAEGAKEDVKPDADMETAKN